MTTDAFTTAARAEAPPECDHHWISHGQSSALIPWVIRCDLCGDFNTAEMDRVARDNLAAQEPTEEEVEAATRVIYVRSHHSTGRQAPWERLDLEEQGAWLEDGRAALTAAKEARRDQA
ncbi:hypothetical protein ACTXM8_10160 [Brachybacterium alimentarium]|uniref:hypothetical protein n=1 Tax=Brachybacterium alimentarium TaxID=47845 RepID=UPI003FD23795